jgi:hypothetical protein
MSAQHVRKGRGIWPNQCGSVAIHIGLMLAVIIGMVALGSEIVFLPYKQSQMQSAADAAAFSGAVALATGYPDATIEAGAIAAQAGFVNGVDQVTVTVHHPPTTGSNIGNDSAVEVVLAQPQSVNMTSLFSSGLFTVGARSVAMTGNNGISCMLALDPAASGSIKIGNNAIVTNHDCGVSDNSNSQTAIILKNNAAINGPVTVVGGWSLSNGATLNGSPNAKSAPASADPYAAVQLQTIPSCSGQSGSAANNATRNLTPGHFCSGWAFTNHVTVNLAPGTYYIDQMMIMANSVLNGTGGVTLVIGANYAIDAGNNNTINLTAPSTGAYAGLAFLGTRSGTPSQTQTFSNNTILNIKGAIYFPSQTIEFDNNGSTTPGGCTQVIGRIIQINNNVELDRNCVGTGVKPITGSASASYLTE